MNRHRADRHGEEMRRFGTIFPFLEKGPSNLRLGRLVANQTFVKSLLKYGTFDEYVFANPSHSNREAFARAADAWKLPGESSPKVRMVSYFDLPRLLQEEAFEVFHLGGWGYFAPGLHYLRGRYASNPWPITAVTHSLTGRQSIDHAVRLCKAGMAPFDSIFCTSRDGQQAMHEILSIASSIAGSSFTGKLDCLPLGIDDDLLRERGDRAKARAQMRILPQAVALLILGRITPSQKMDLGPVLTTIAHRVLPHCQRPVNLIIGGGADPQNLKLLTAILQENGLEQRTRVRANFQEDSKVDLLAAADIFLSLADNHQETFGLSILEAQAHALPVIASRFDGYKDLVNEAVDGYLIDSYGCAADPLSELFDLMDPDIGELFEAQKIAIDMDQFAAKLTALIHDDSLRAAMGAHGRTKVEEQYAFSRIIARYERRWKELSREAGHTGLARDVGLAFHADQSRIFGHFVARNIQPTDTVVAQPAQSICPSYNEISALLDPAELQRMLLEAARPVTVADLISGTGLPLEKGWFMVMWLMKNNLLRPVLQPAP
jgi:glycosyltransferase involved in cell wall biosynthesis